METANTGFYADADSITCGCISMRRRAWLLLLVSRLLPDVYFYKIARGCCPPVGLGKSSISSLWDCSGSLNQKRIFKTGNNMVAVIARVSRSARLANVRIYLSLPQIERVYASLLPGALISRHLF